MGIWLAVAAINGLLAVAAGAFGAHAIQGHLDARAMDVFETAARYHMYHALAIGLAALAIKENPAGHAATWAAVFFLAGIIIFSGSLYTLSLTGIRWLGAITPIGGLSFMAGWAMLIITGLRLRG